MYQLVISCHDGRLLQGVLSNHDSPAIISKVILSTTRPDWNRCADYVEGGEERWSELSKGLSSEELMEVLLAELAGVDPSEITRDVVFQGKVGMTIIDNK